MFSISDTIVAIATPPGRGGIGVVRLSGPCAHDIAVRLTDRGVPFQPRHATLATVVASSPPPPKASARLAEGGSRIQESDVVSSHAIDHAVVTYFPSPASYTGDDVVEISVHGNPVVLNTIVVAAMANGSRLAERGEFTLRAFLNGRIDLTQAEAIADLIESVTPAQAHAAFDQLNGTLTTAIAALDAALFDLIARLEASVDFPDEGYHFVDPGVLVSSVDAIVVQTTALLRNAQGGRLLREGLQIAIVGPPNVGKSSLFNALVGSARAIVTNVPGTTRDLVSEAIDLDGLRVTLVDTAGLRETSDVVESQGVSRSRGAASVADLVIVVHDLSQAIEGDGEAFPFDSRRSVMVGNKADLPRLWSRQDVVEVSAITGAGLDQLRQRIGSVLALTDHGDRPAITNVRHIALVEQAQDALIRARSAAMGEGASASEEFVLADLQEARAALEEIIGKRAPDDLLAQIFERFCVGK